MAGTKINGAPRGVVAMGTPAGGVEAPTAVAGKLPSDLPYAVLVALHLPPKRAQRSCQDHGLHQVADDGRRAQLPVQGWSRLDCRCLAEGTRRRDRECTVGGPAASARERDAIATMANDVSPGMLHSRYTELADEADDAVTVLGRRLSEAVSGAGEPSDR